MFSSASIFSFFLSFQENKNRKLTIIMFAIAPFSPAISPAIRPPLLEPTASPPFPSPPLPSVSTSPSAPPVTSPETTSPPPSLSPIVPLPTSSAPPVTPPGSSNPPAFNSPSPGSSIVPASPPPITSNENPDPPTPSPPTPATLTPPAVPFLSPVTSASTPPPRSSHRRKVAPATPRSPPPTLSSHHQKEAPATPASPPPPQSSHHRKDAPAPSAPTTTSSPPALAEAKPPTPRKASPPARAATVPPLTEPPLSSLPAPAPSSPSPETKPPSESLPVAVEVEKHTEFNLTSGLIVGIVIGGSHIIRMPLNPPHLVEGGGAFGAVNSGDVTSIPNHSAASIAFGSVGGNFTYEELVVATNGLYEANLLGEGGFGYVYKGVLPSGKEIAVKQLKTGSEQGEREFQAEVETISMVHHKHLVELVGYCVTRAERLLVYEFVPNNTLEFHLHGEGKPVVEWEKRIKIALGSAKGLAYLHEDCNPAIIHRDIKASNILLDFNFEAKVSDFGLAKIFPNADGYITHLTTRVVGTFGYLAPEYASSGKLTDKSDVYSYGVMLLELITGRPPITAAGSRNESLVDWARPLLARALQDGDFNNLIDPRLQKNYGADEMARMITCAAACVRHSARLRPRMSQIVSALEGVASLTDLVGDIGPGNASLYSWSDSSNYDAYQYQQDLRNLNLALSSQRHSSSGSSESTSAYGLHLSASSSEVQQTIQDM